MEILGGPHFAVAGAGESHGPAITTIVHGTPAGFELKRAEIQSYLDRRRPGGNKHGTPRNEKDKVVLLSGLYRDDVDRLLGGDDADGGRLQVQLGPASFATECYDDGLTTGEPIAAIVLSTSKKSGDYTQLSGQQGAVRPGHTDLVKWHQSRGHVDVRGGGRSSYRSTISDVIGGSIARIGLRQMFGTEIVSSIRQVGALEATTTIESMVDQDSKSLSNVDSIKKQLEGSEIPSVDGDFATQAGELIKQTRKQGDSLGALVEVAAFNVPPLLGSPLYNSLKVRLMGALGGLNAVQSCEIGVGKDAVAKRGSENNDAIRHDGYQSNSHGGLIGGITTGSPLIARIGFKPTSTIHLPQQSVRKNLEEVTFELTKGRHDPCVGVRAGVTLESRMAIELLNALLAFQAQSHVSDAINLFDRG
ncbi:MAG: chorismate synthase [Planctomycetota bacterium]